MSDLKTLLRETITHLTFIAESQIDYQRIESLEAALKSLELLPKLREEKSYLTDLELGFVNGWNYCVEEMMDVIEDAK